MPTRRNFIISIISMPLVALFPKLVLSKRLTPEERLNAGIQKIIDSMGCFQGVQREHVIASSTYIAGGHDLDYTVDKFIKEFEPRVYKVCDRGWIGWRREPYITSERDFYTGRTIHRIFCRFFHEVDPRGMPSQLEILTEEGYYLYANT